MLWSNTKNADYNNSYYDKIKTQPTWELLIVHVLEQ